MTGATLARANVARAIPDYAVNGAMATAGATAAAVFIRATSGRGDALPTPAAALAEAPVAAEAEEAAAVVSEDLRFPSPSRMSRRWTPKRWRFNFWMRFRRGRRHSRRAFRRRRSWR